MAYILYPDARFKDDGVTESSLLGGRSDIEVGIFHERPEGGSDAPLGAFARCDVLVVYHKVKVDEPLLNRMPHCRLVVRAGVGLNNIDLKACSARGVPVCNVPDYGTSEVADHTVALLLTLVRGTAAYHERLHAEPRIGWRFDGIRPVRRIAGSTLGIVGLGRIGKAVAERAAGFGMKIVHFGGKQSFGCERVNSMTELLGRSDVLSLHVPLTPATQGLIDANAVAAMKPNLILINTARGALIDSAALYQGLRSGSIAAAGLDVLQSEPPDLADPLISAWQRGEIWLRDQLLITPHAAFYSEAGFTDLRRSAIRIAIAFLDGEKLHNCVNEPELKRFPVDLKEPQ